MSSWSKLLDSQLEQYKQQHAPPPPSRSAGTTTTTTTTATNNTSSSSTTTTATNNSNASKSVPANNVTSADAVIEEIKANGGGGGGGDGEGGGKHLSIPKKADKQSGKGGLRKSSTVAMSTSPLAPKARTESLENLHDQKERVDVGGKAGGSNIILIDRCTDCAEIRTAGVGVRMFISHCSNCNIYLDHKILTGMIEVVRCNNVQLFVNVGGISTTQIDMCIDFSMIFNDDAHVGEFWVNRVQALSLIVPSVARVTRNRHRGVLFENWSDNQFRLRISNGVLQTDLVKREGTGYVEISAEEEEAMLREVKAMSKQAQAAKRREELLGGDDAKRGKRAIEANSASNNSNDAADESGKILDDIQEDDEIFKLDT